MIRAKEQLMETQKIKDDTLLAEKLGLTYEELRETDWHIERAESNDSFFNQHILCFNDGPKHILRKIIGLDSNNQVWLDTYEMDGDYDNYFGDEELFNVRKTNKYYYDSFQKEIVNLTKLNDLTLESNELETTLKYQLYNSAIGTLETFLSETLINQTDENPEYFKKFVETCSNFSEQKFPLNEIFVQYDQLKKTTRKEIVEINYRDIDKVYDIYVSTFEITFSNITELSKLITTRHNLVYRNVKTSKGEEVIITKNLVSDLIAEILKLVEEIALALKLKV